ncbi:phasin family protein [Spirulina major CS-329]|jgi:polyhydroxyalkanoate synthesis regulator phasin|uniref:phasin family protein n=1 Tax=Spirulina TaxID=1154 RepID=UPI00093243B5|nr:MULTISPECIES: phasin family protein [Spirulina]MDB9493559.1 phasin family protein [Spirulina subsalsa CS-330]MDB9503871.1 phasin family protein [Spirulina major CS-329]
MENTNWIQEMLMIGVGTTSFLAEKLTEVGDQLVTEGKIDPEQARTIIDEVVGKVKTEQGNFEERMQIQLRNVLQDFGVARQSEVDELRGRIDRLEHQVRDLENKLWR